MQVRHSKGMRIFVGRQLSFCKHVLFVSGGVEHEFEINVHTCTLISSHRYPFDAPISSPIERDTLYLTGFKLLDFWDLRTSFLTSKSAR
jgi:hypothetical protein